MASLSNYYSGGMGQSDFLPVSLSAMRYGPQQAAKKYTVSGYGTRNVETTPMSGGGLGGSGGLASMGLGGIGGGLSIGGLIGMQRDENARNRAMTEANWQEGKRNLAGVMPGYMSDPMTTGARGLAANLMANPEAINDQTQSLIRNAQMNQLGAQGNSAMRRGSAQLASRGQLNPAAQARMQERIGMGTQAAMSRALAQTEIDRALRRNQDIMAAMGAGRQLGNDQAGLNMDVQKTFLENMPQYLPEDLSGMAALLAQTQSGGGMFGARAGAKTPNAGAGFGFNMGSLNQMGQQSPGQTGFAPGQRGSYQWTGQDSGGGYGVDTRRLGSGSVPYWQQRETTPGGWWDQMSQAPDFSPLWSYERL